MRKYLTGILLIMCLAISGKATESGFPIDMDEMKDVSTLDVKVLSDWHVVDGPVKTRQKLINIHVGYFGNWKEFRIPVRMIVPVDKKAKGFHLTGGHNLKDIKKDAVVKGADAELIKRGVGQVYTIVQEPGSYGEMQLGLDFSRSFITTLHPRNSIQYWGWPAILMRSITAAYAEKDYFEEGKIAATGGSKNGASPSTAIIQDKRITGLFATVSPIWESPLRLCDKDAWKELKAYNKEYAEKVAAGDKKKIYKINNHFFLGGTFGPVYNRRAMNAGHKWEEIKALAEQMEDYVFISKNLDQLKERNCDIYFHPGTHDFVCFDIAWGGKHYPQIPLYLAINSGHSQRSGSSVEKQQNLDAFLLRHFFKDEVEPMPVSPAVKYEKVGNKLLVKVKFPEGERSESGRIWWMYDRAPDGSYAYIDVRFPEEQYKDMVFDEKSGAWTAEIELLKGKSHIDFFSNHRKTIKYQAKKYSTYISSPYTRVKL